MATVPSGQIKNMFTQDLIAVLNIVPPETTCLQDKFRTVYKPTDYIQWQTRRITETKADPTLRGTNGSRVKATGFTQKIEQPPFYHLYFNIMQLDGFNAAFGTNNPAESAIDDLMEQTVFMYGEMKKMVKRTWEYQSAQIFQTGTITDSITGNIPFSRNTDSFGDAGAGNYWDNNTRSPFDDMERGGRFLRAYGKITTTTIDCYMGASAYRAFLENTIVLSRAQKLWNELTSLTMPTPRGDGSVFMGQVSAGPYLVNIYTYPQFYAASTEYQPAATITTVAGDISQTATANTSTPYIADYNIIMLPSATPNLIFGSALVPRLPAQLAGGDSMIGAGGEIEGGKFFAYDYQDVKLTAWEGNLKAVGVPLLTAVDEVYTAKVMGA